MREGQGERGVGDLRWVGCGLLVGGKSKDQQGLMKDRVREGDTDRDIYSERGIGCGRDRVREGQGERGVGD